MARSKKSIQSFKISLENENSQYNLNIFNVLKKETATSVKDISVKTDISEAIVAGYINSCVKKDLLRISGSGEGGLVRFNGDYKKILGIGFSNDKCILTIMDLAGNIIAREQIKINPFMGMKGKTKEIKEVIETIKSKTKLCKTELHLAGIGMPVEVNRMNPRCADILADGVRCLFDCDVLIAKETTAFGYGERDIGDKTKGKDLLYMHLDIGDGVVFKNEMIFEATNSNEQEKEACLRPWSQFSVVSTAKSLVSKGVGTSIVNMVSGNIEAITLETVLDAAENHDELAEDLVKRAGLALGVRVAYLVNMFNTEIVILGGGTEKKEGEFIKFVKESAGRFLLKNLVGKVKIIPSVLEEKAFSVGAASLCRRELFMEV